MSTRRAHGSFCNCDFFPIFTFFLCLALATTCRQCANYKNHGPIDYGASFFYHTHYLWHHGIFAPSWKIDDKSSSSVVVVVVEAEISIEVHIFTNLISTAAGGACAL